MAKPALPTIVLIMGCGAREPAPIANVGSSTLAGFPCGAATIAELSPFENARCEPNGSCLRGKARRGVGTCTIAASSSFDLDAGHERLTVSEGDQRILSEDAPPYARTVVFDPRIPTPDGIRVGMTGMDLERLVPPFTEIDCTFDDSAWRGHLLCSLRKQHHPECDVEEANGSLVVFASDDRILHARAPVGGATARALVRMARVVAVDLGPPCN